MVSILEKYLKGQNLKPENQTSAIIFLGVTSPFIKTNSVEGISKKILQLFEKGQESMQKNLSKCL